MKFWQRACRNDRRYLQVQRIRALLRATLGIPTGGARGLAGDMFDNRRAARTSDVGRSPSRTGQRVPPISRSGCWSGGLSRASRVARAAGHTRRPVEQLHRVHDRGKRVPERPAMQPMLPVAMTSGFVSSMLRALRSQLRGHFRACSMLYVPADPADAPWRARRARHESRVSEQRWGERVQLLPVLKRTGRVIRHSGGAASSAPAALHVPAPGPQPATQFPAAWRLEGLCSAPSRPAIEGFFSNSANTPEISRARCDTRAAFAAYSSSVRNRNPQSLSIVPQPEAVTTICGPTPRLDLTSPRIDIPFRLTHRVMLAPR